MSAVTCRSCHHPASHHDAGECWTRADGTETWSDVPDQCECAWYEPESEGGAS